MYWLDFWPLFQKDSKVDGIVHIHIVYWEFLLLKIGYNTCSCIIWRRIFMKMKNMLWSNIIWCWYLRKFDFCSLQCCFFKEFSENVFTFLPQTSRLQVNVRQCIQHIKSLDKHLTLPTWSFIALFYGASYFISCFSLRYKQEKQLLSVAKILEKLHFVKCQTFFEHSVA